jgi:hypothetical protein
VIRYRCQYTELAAASTFMRDWDLMQDLRPLLSGNIGPTAFLVAMFTRLFNYVQSLRGGIGFPAMTMIPRNETPVVNLNLMAGDVVRVLTANEISKTLNSQGKNRGLWFDRDMLKQAGQSFTVLTRIERIIDDVTGCMLKMKTPCIVLGDVVGSGEFLRFCAQHDYTYWREAWLSLISIPRRGRPPIPYYSGHGKAHADNG